VAIAADTRSTAGHIVGAKNCEKIHYLAPNIRCCGAGTAADCDHVTGKKSHFIFMRLPSSEILILLTKKSLCIEMIKRDLELHRLNTHSESRVQMAANRAAEHLFRYQGQVGLHAIMGGVDVKGPQLMEISNDGNHYQGNFLTMGSGSLAAMGVFESEYKENMTEEEAVTLVTKAIEAGIYHDLGSGSNVDVSIIKKGKVDYLRNLKSDNKKMWSKPDGYKFHKDRVNVLATYVDQGVLAVSNE